MKYRMEIEVDELDTSNFCKTSLDEAVKYAVEIMRESVFTDQKVTLIGFHKIITSRKKKQ